MLVGVDEIVVGRIVEKNESESYSKASQGRTV
jgi:hypothetical protein